ncbi:MAG: hypothetical protein QM692_20210 [Thermomicrobiales bacterium]
MRLYLGMERELLVVDPERPGEARRHLQTLPITSLAVDPLRPERIYCGTFGQGLWRSNNAGDSWSPTPGVMRSALVHSVAVSSVETAHGYGVVYAGTEPAALYRSEDGGATWRELTALQALPSSANWSFPPRPHSNLARWIALHPTRPGRLALAIEAGALVRSDDGGETWQDTRPGSPYDTHTVAFHPARPDLLISAAGDGLFESPDAGDSWRRAEPAPYPYLWGLALHPGDPEVVLVSAAPGPGQGHGLRGETRSGIFRKWRGEPWQASRAGLPDDAGTILPVLTADPATPGAVYALSNKGFFHSRDFGGAWEPLPVPWPNALLRQHAQALAIGA